MRIIHGLLNKEEGRGGGGLKWAMVPLPWTCLCQSKHGSFPPPSQSRTRSPQALCPAVTQYPRRDSGVLEFYYRRISAVKQWKPLRSLYRAANQKI